MMKVVVRAVFKAKKLLLELDHALLIAFVWIFCYNGIRSE